MVKGLVIGKFMPLHKGHEALIEFAAQNCDHLTVLLCSTINEPIPGIKREEWLNLHYPQNDIEVYHLEYDEAELPNTSESSIDVSRVWSAKIKEILPNINRLFSSEPYGKFVTDFLGIEHQSFELSRTSFPISATEIRNNPFKNWDLISKVSRSYFVFKVAIVGTESTGKTTLTKKLAAHFNTSFAKEMGREIVPKTEECTMDHLHQIAVKQAEEIKNATAAANKIMFSDTELNITKSYAQFLFNQELIVNDRVEEINQFDLVLYLENDAKYTQDGTRLENSRRDELDQSHRLHFREQKVVFINGDWEERFQKSLAEIAKIYS